MTSDPLGIRTRELRVECIGVDSLYAKAAPGGGRPSDTGDVRLRVAARTDTREEATQVAHEVDALALSGPAAGGIAALSVREVLGVASTYVPRELVRASVEMLES